MSSEARIASFATHVNPSEIRWLIILQRESFYRQVSEENSEAAEEAPDNSGERGCGFPEEKRKFWRKPNLRAIQFIRLANSPANKR